MDILELLDKNGDQLGIIRFQMEFGIVKGHISPELKKAIEENLDKLSEIQKANLSHRTSEANKCYHINYFQKSRWCIRR